MLRSMTGYGFAETVTGKYLMKCEVKSLNGKFIDLNLRLPKIFSDREMYLRNYLNTRIFRGTATISITVEKQKTGVAAQVTLNKDLARSYYESWMALSAELGAEGARVFENLMLVPELISSEETAYDEQDWNNLFETLQTALERFEQFRLDEGASLCRLLEAHCRSIEQMLPEIEVFEPERLETIRQRLEKNLGEFMNKEGFDPGRFEQELLFYLEKTDTSEEKNRLKAHCTYFLQTLKEPESGRKLNFIAQEMGREINTLGSKASHAGMQKIVVGMKEELEKIKEQVLNVL